MKPELKTRLLKERMFGEALPSVSLDELVGLHMLDAFDLGAVQYNHPYYDDAFENAQQLRFRIDGITIVAIQDPNDGYRSSMGELYVAPHADMPNSFEAVQVFGHLQDHILTLRDVMTGLPVVMVGTDYSDDYYPHWVGVLHPDNMYVNFNQIGERLKDGRDL